MERPQDDVPIVRERAAAFIGNWRLITMLIAFGAMALVVVTVVGFSTALFTSTSSTPDNTFAAGAVELKLTSAGQLINGAAFAPGVTRAGTQTVTNVDHRSTLRLSVADLASGSALGDVLRIVVKQTSPAVANPLYDGGLRGLAGLDLGVFAAGEKRSYSLELTWPANQNAASLQGATVSFTFAWSAESVS